MLARYAIRLLLATAACSTAGAAMAQTAAPASTATASTTNHSESGRVTMVRSASDSCIPGDANFRRQVFPIRFQFPFANNRYSVVLALSGLDVDHNRNVRIDTQAINRMREGMTIVAMTWCNTIIEAANIDYLVAGYRAPPPH